MLRAVPNAGAFIDCVLAAAEAQDRRVERDQLAIAPARIPEADAHLCGFSTMDPEKLREAAAKGGASSAPKPRGLAAVAPERRREIAAMGRAARRKNQAVVRAAAFPAPADVIVQRPAQHYGLTPQEFQVYGILRAKHGMTQDQAIAAVMRSRRAAPGGIA